MEIIKTIEQLERFIATNRDCDLIVSKKLDEKINRSFSTDLRRPPEDMDLFFKLHGFMNIMIKNNIRYIVEK